MVNVHKGQMKLTSSASSTESQKGASCKINEVFNFDTHRDSRVRGGRGLANITDVFLGKLLLTRSVLFSKKRVQISNLIKI